MSVLNILLVWENPRLLNITTQPHIVLRRTRWPLNRFRVLSQGSSLSQELSATSNLNLFPQFCKARVYTGLTPGSHILSKGLVVWYTCAHTHRRHVESIPWSLEVVVALRGILLSSLCTHHQSPWSKLEPGGLGKKTPLWSQGVVWFLGENVHLRSGLAQVANAPQRYVLLLDIAFGLQLRPHVLRNWFIDRLYTTDNNQVVYNLPSCCSSNLHAHSGLYSTFYKW